jgi:hypothetical protein
MMDNDVHVVLSTNIVPKNISSMRILIARIFDIYARHRVNLFAQFYIYAGLTVFTQDYLLGMA